MYGWGRWPEYVSVEKRKTQAVKKIAAMKKQGQNINPVIIEGKNITSTFWGKAWCENMESYSDYSNRLPRGRSYVRHGSVIDLNIGQGKIDALVNGASIYQISITIKPVSNNKWKNIVNSCAGKIDSLIELLQGAFSKSVMEIITHKKQGLFPSPAEIKLHCSCPDHANMCKHVAATMYAIGARLDIQPQDLFLLRHVDYSELITAAGSAEKLSSKAKLIKILKDANLSTLFGIEIQSTHSGTKKPNKRKICNKKQYISKKNKLKSNS